MTNPEEQAQASQGNLLPPPDLRLRVKPAQFARMAGVTKQAVAKAIRSGRIRLDADGLLNPHRAAREWIENTNPALIRSRLLRDLAKDHADVRRARDDWKARAERAASERERARAELSALKVDQAERERRAVTARGRRDQDRLGVALAEITAEADQVARSILHRHGPERLALAIMRGTLARLVERYAVPRLFLACVEAGDADTCGGA